MEDFSDDEDNTTHFGKGPPQQVVHPTPAAAHAGKSSRQVKIEDQLQAAQVLHDNVAVHKATLQD